MKETHVRGVRGERRKTSEEKRRYKEGGDREKDGCAGEEMIVDLEKGQHRYAGRLLL